MKSILLHVNDDSGLEARVQAALALAQRHGGHISCVQVTPFNYYSGGDPFGGVYVFADVIDSVRAQERAVRATLETRLAAAGVPFDWRKLDGDVIQSLIDQARLMDIIVLSLPQGGDVARPPLPIAGDIAINARAPVLAIGPVGDTATGTAFDPAGCAMVAWNGSAEAAHALQLSLSLLHGASAVHIVGVSEEASGLPSTEAALYLSRHGIAAEVHEWPAKGRKVDVALLHAAAELDAAFMVLGAYGHSRLRETIFGGVTRELLRHSHVPLVFAH